MEDCVFCQIAQGKISKKFTAESKNVMVFPDINPVAPLHLLIVPKKHIEDLMAFKKVEENIFEEMIRMVKELVEKNNLSAYRLVINGGSAKLVNHLHVHLMGGIDAHRKI
ncbi:HIT domain-containing protein [Candidatus Microgenomates bacterium]|nr:HIT domain-containing protein [Candidatus Microgenomates bacterium]